MFWLGVLVGMMIAGPLMYVVAVLLNDPWRNL